MWILDVYYQLVDAGWELETALALARYGVAQAAYEAWERACKE